MGDRGARNEDISPRVLDDMKRDLINVWQRSEAGQTEVFESLAVACVRLGRLPRSQPFAASRNCPTKRPTSSL
jgi:hypothetical protein